MSAPRISAANFRTHAVVQDSATRKGKRRGRVKIDGGEAHDERRHLEVDKPLRILIVEDSPADAELCKRQLLRGGLKFVVERLQTRDAFEGALCELAPDVILSDFSMPTFSGMEALAIARKLCPDIPFIFVSGTIGEENAIKALKDGATDYVLKTNLVRLSIVVERALVEARRRRELRRAEAELRESERVKHAIFASSLDGIVIIDHAGIIVEFNPAAEATFGITREQALSRAMVDLIIPSGNSHGDVGAFANILANGDGDIIGKRIELIAVRAQGGEFPVELAVTSGGTESKPLFTVFIRDISARKQAEEKIKRLNRMYAVLSGINAAIFRLRDRQDLFQEVCRIATDDGQFRMVWLGILDNNATRVKPVACAGDVRDFLDLAQVSVMDDVSDGYSLPGRAVREKKPFISNDIRNDPQRLMKGECEERGINSP